MPWVIVVLVIGALLWGYTIEKRMDQLQSRIDALEGPFEED